jgi:hypothetical protein
MTILEACLCAAVAGAVLLVVQWLLAVRFGRLLANRLAAKPVQAPAPSLGQPLPVPAGAAERVRKTCQCPMCRRAVQVTPLPPDQVTCIEQAIAIVGAGHMRGMGVPLEKLSADGVSADVHVMVLDGRLVRDVVLPAIKAATSPRTEHG